MARVLVIDDVPDVLNLWARTLSQDGHVVFKAAGFKDGERILLSEDLDVVVTDLVFPDGDGLALIALARAVRPRVGILAVSGGSTPGGPRLAQAIAAGADATMAKPIRSSDLRSAVARLRK
ncbi:MAG: response regulator [Rhodospirillales bacterium]